MPRWVSIPGGNILLGGLLLSVLFLAGEAYFRFRFDGSDAHGLTRVSRRWMARHYRYNNAGIRDTMPYEVAVAPGRRRVAFFGDSFAVGHGVEVEERFVNLVRASAPEWEIQLWGANGWGTMDELLRLRALGDSYRASAIVLVYNLNDVMAFERTWIALDREHAHAGREGWLVRHSYLANLLFYRWQLRRRPDLSRYFELIREAYDSGAWEQEARYLDRFRERCAALGIPLLAVTFPLVHELGKEYPYRAAHEKIARFWRASGVPHLDLLDVFREARPADLVVNPLDSHPNARAHRMAASAILPFVRANVGAP